MMASRVLSDTGHGVSTVADQLTRKTREENTATFVHKGLEILVAQKKAGVAVPSSSCVPFVILTLKPSMPLLGSALVAKGKDLGLDATPTWAHGAKIVTPCFTRQVAKRSPILLGPSHNIMQESL